MKKANQLIPLPYAGNGMVRLLTICLAIMSHREGLVLIDELETGFHYSMYGKLWAVIDRLSKEYTCQVIATTHSYELIEAVREGIVHSEDFSYYRMGKYKDGIGSFRYAYSMLASALAAEMEVR